MKSYREAEWLLLGQTLQLTQKEVAENAGCTESTILRWESKLNVKRGDSYINIEREELLNDLLRVANIVDGTPSQPEYNEHGKHAHKTFSLRFGSWCDAQEAAGLKPNKNLSKLASKTRLDDEDWLRQSYSEMSTREIANAVGWTSKGVWNVLQRMGIETRSSSSHSVHCDILNTEVDSRVERAFARGLDEAGILDQADYQPECIDGWEPDFKIGEWLVECKHGDITAAMGGEPARQAPAMEACESPVLVYGLKSDGEDLPHDRFIEYVPGEVPDLSRFA